MIGDPIHFSDVIHSTQWFIFTLAKVKHCPLVIKRKNAHLFPYEGDGRTTEAGVIAGQIEASMREGGGMDLFDLLSLLPVD